MSEGVNRLGGRGSLTRREFTLDAALAILAGCVITIGDTACGSSPAAPAAVVPPSDVTGVVAANHAAPHIAVITGAHITDGGAYTLDIQGQATHSHTLSIAQTDLATLKNKQPITSLSTTNSGHSHSVTFTPV